MPQLSAGRTDAKPGMAITSILDNGSDTLK